MKLSRRTMLGLAAATVVVQSANAQTAFDAWMQKQRNFFGGSSRSQPSEAGDEVYLLRGFADVFSRGLDQMGQELERRGVTAHVERHTSWRSVASRIIADYGRSGPRPVVLIGHSLGANAAILVAERLGRARIPVDYMATFAATDPDPVPGNVRRVVNYYFATDGWGEPLVPGSGFVGKLSNRDFSHSADIGHFNIDKQQPLQREVIAEVMRTLRRR